MTECPCTFSKPWCDAIAAVRSQPSTAVAKRDAEVSFKVFGTMGIRDYSGAPRQPIFDRWTAARALSVGP